ncbi:hypothetical protein G6F31_020335 [Rhizopus arrhizus]|nr:hypothetical protein G6F31_020335 [Rhizopus arrhizus]
MLRRPPRSPLYPTTTLFRSEIDNNRITRIVARSRDEEPLPAGAADIVDASGLTVMPGLIDAHCHISYGVARAIEEQDLRALPRSAIRVAAGMWPSPCGTPSRRACFPGPEFPRRGAI